MLAELLAYWTTRCSDDSRRKGYLHEAIAIEARYKRCRASWQPHLDQCHRVILEAAESCSVRDKVIILGSGALLDIPIQSLATLFEEVVLIDRVHPKTARRKIKHLPNIRMLEADLGGVETIPFPEEDGASLIVSANLLSQLSLIPMRQLPKEKRKALGRKIVETHVARLKNAKAMSCLIADTTHCRITPDGQIAAEEDMLFGVTLPPAESSWEWHIAPRPEIDRSYDRMHRVVVLRLY